jgi:hypothetical protein
VEVALEHAMAAMAIDAEVEVNIPHPHAVVEHAEVDIPHSTTRRRFARFIPIGYSNDSQTGTVKNEPKYKTDGRGRGG